MSDLNIRKIGAVIFTIGAFVLLVVSILVNDRFINLVILFALVSVILSSTNKSKESTVPAKSPNKILIWISVLLIIVGIIFAIIV